MIDYYKEEFLINGKKQKKRTLIVYYVVLSIYLLISVGMFLFYLTLPYKSPKITTVKLIEYPLTGIFVIFSFVYLTIKVKRVRKYCKLCTNLSTGLRETSEATFSGYKEDSQEKDGVDMKALIFSEWNKYKKGYFDRKVLVFYEEPFPVFNEGDKVRFITQGNVLISYEKISEEE